MRRPLAGDTPCMVKINVTPIIDVALVLVIILLVTAPILTVADVDLQLPAAHTRGAEDSRRISVSLGRDGVLAVDEEMIGMPMLASSIRQRIEEWGDDRTLVVVRADAAASHGEIRALMKQIKASGAQRVAVATTQAGESDR
jgi:biopolymer transport protein TolR